MMFFIVGDIFRIVNEIFYIRKCRVVLIYKVMIVTKPACRSIGKSNYA